MKRKLCLAFFYIILPIVISGCGKANVENKTMSIKVLNQNVIGVYSGECKKELADGNGIFRGNNSFTAEGLFVEGELTVGTINDFETNITIDSQTLKVLYSGEYNNGLNGKGTIHDNDSFSAEGTFVNGIFSAGTVDNLNSTIDIYNNSYNGFYSGDYNDGITGKGKYSDTNTFTAEGSFTKGNFSEGTVNNFITTMCINGENINGVYSGSYNNGATGKGRFDFSKGSYKIALEGDFLNHILTTGKVNDFPLDVEITGINYSGKYNGEITNNDITGQGEFKASGIDYIGGFEKGKPSGNGEYRKSTYVVDYSDGTNRKGKYDGKCFNGIADGEGEFNAKTDDGIKYTYTGEWKDGLFNGKGSLIYKSKDYYKRLGTFKNGEFNPTAVEAFTSIGTDNDEPFSISENAANYIEQHSNLFTGKASKKAIKKAKEKASSLPSFNTLKNNINKYGNKLMKVTIKPFQFNKTSYWQYEKSGYCLVTYGGFYDILYITFLKLPDGLKENQSFTAYVVPMDYSSYKSVSNRTIMCIRAAGIAY